MNGFDRLKEQVKDQKDVALKQTVDYLISRKDMEQKYLNEEKTLEEMCDFIKSKGQAHSKNGWNYITNEIVFAWAIMYFSLPNSFLKINSHKSKKSISKTKETSQNIKNNIILLKDAKSKINNNKEVKQLSFWGGTSNEQ